MLSNITWKYVAQLEYNAFEYLMSLKYGLSKNHDRILVIIQLERCQQQHFLQTERKKNDFYHKNPSIYQWIYANSINDKVYK